MDHFLLFNFFVLPLSPLFLPDKGLTDRRIDFDAVHSLQLLSFTNLVLLSLLTKDKNRNFNLPNL